MRVRLRQQPERLARDTHLRRLLRRASWRPGHSSQTARSSASSGTRSVRIELVQVPAQSLLSATPLVDEVVAIVDQQLQLP